MSRHAALVLLLLAGISPVFAAITVGSKNFNEGYLLGEIMAQILELAGYEVERKFGLGGTLVCYEALANGEIDVYAEYSGTLSQVILKTNDLAPKLDELNAQLAHRGLAVLASFGFNNTYAMAIKKSLALEKGISRVSELSGHPHLEMALSLEFLNREDGWPGLAKTYHLSGRPTGIEHGLAYRAIDEGKIDITDAYSTDGDLERYGLTVLEDDLGYFPEYFCRAFRSLDITRTGDYGSRAARRYH